MHMDRSQARCYFVKSKGPVRATHHKDCPFNLKVLINLETIFFKKGLRICHGLYKSCLC